MIQYDSPIRSNNQMVRGSDWFDSFTLSDDSFVYLISSLVIRCGSVRFKDGSVHI